MAGRSRDPRALAVRVLAAVLDGRSLDDALARHEPQCPQRDRALLRELAYGLCRWHRRLDLLVSERLRRPLRARDREIHLLMLLGLHQLLHVRVPDHAAVSTVVALARGAGGWAGGLVNGVLRGLQRDLADPDGPLRRRLAREPALRFAQPDWLLDALRAAWPGRHEAVLDALQQRPPMTLRVNRLRTTPEAMRERLAAEGLDARAVPGAPDALVLERPVPAERLPGLAEGLLSVQDAGAQLAAPLLDAAPGQRVLDACAAPGGKTGHLLERTPDLELTAVDVDAERLARVAENLDRLGLAARLEARDAAAPPAAWRARPFDRILLDAPCSATGVMRRHPDIRLLRRRQDVPALARRQSALLEALWPCLRPGGKLLYCTCSLLPEENEQRIMRFLERHPEARLADLPSLPGAPRAAGWQTLPGEATMDGFYYALLEKRDA